MSATDPANIILSALTVRLITGAAHKNNLGTNYPSQLIIGIDDLKQYLYMIPVAPKTPGATRLTYRDSQAYMKLYEAFMQLDRLVLPGIREYYAVHPTPGEVTIRQTIQNQGKVIVREVVKGWGVYADLTDVTKEPIKHLSEEEKARRTAKRAQTIAAKAAMKQHT